MLINYVQQTYSAGVYLRKDIWYGNVTDLVLLNNDNKHNIQNKQNKHNNQCDAEFDMKVLKRKENYNTIFRGRSNTEEGNEILYSLFTDQFEPPPQESIKGE